MTTLPLLGSRTYGALDLVVLSALGVTVAFFVVRDMLRRRALHRVLFTLSKPVTSDELSRLPQEDVWPKDFDPNARLGAQHVVVIGNGQGAELVVKVRGGAFRVVSFTRPVQFARLDVEGDTTDMWISIDEFVEKVRRPWS